ncbi:MAG: hypothetical protein WD250_00310 [Egibacteraceae bacterium]
MSLVELMVAAVLLLVVGTIVATGVVSAHEVTRHTESRITALTAIHQAVAGVSREIRAGDSRDITGAALGAASPSSLETDVFRGDPVQRMRLTFTVTDGVLTERRRVWAAGADPADAPVSDVTRTLLTEIVTDGTQPLFAYYAADGSCITGCTDGSGTFISTAVLEAALDQVAEVHLTVRHALEGGRSPIEVATRVTLRNA